MRFRAQAALCGVPGPEEDAARGGFNPLQCPSGAVRVLSELLAVSQPPPSLPAAAPPEVLMPCLITQVTECEARCVTAHCLAGPTASPAVGGSADQITPALTMDRFSP